MAISREEIETWKGEPMKATIGWREWVELPDLDIGTVKAKVDTGARTSSLHAWDIESFTRRGREWVRFKIHPEQRKQRPEFLVEAPLKEHRGVRPSTGRRERRPVILTTVELMGQRWQIELTLTNRDEMGFRMLLGRQALKGRFIVDPGTSFLNGVRVKGTRRMKRTGSKKNGRSRP